MLEGEFCFSRCGLRLLFLFPSVFAACHPLADANLSRIQTEHGTRAAPRITSQVLHELCLFRDIAQHLSTEDSRVNRGPKISGILATVLAGCRPMITELGPYIDRRVLATARNKGTPFLPTADDVDYLRSMHAFA